MPLPSEKDDKIRNHFDELIAEVESLLAELDEYDPCQYSRYRQWIVKTDALLQMLFDNSKQGEKYQEIILYDTSLGQSSGSPHWYMTAHDILRKAAALKGIRDSYINGFYVSLEQKIVANVSADYMEQAEALLEAGYYVPTAVLCGAVLEDALRRLCQRQTPPIDIVKSNGDKKTLEPLIQDLQKANEFNKLVADQLRAWAKIRNYAAHGEFSEFTREQVDLMLPGVKQFLAEHL